VANSASGVTVGYRDHDGRSQQIDADYCVCTIPFPVLSRLALSGFADEKMRAINEYQLMPLGRVFFQTKSRFWKNDPLGELGGLRMIGTDTAADRIWNVSEIQGIPEGMLQSYLFPRSATALQAVPSATEPTRSRLRSSASCLDSRTRSLQPTRSCGRRIHSSSARSHSPSPANSPGSSTRHEGQTDAHTSPVSTPACVSAG
jgi:monoamine oxidase